MSNENEEVRKIEEKLHQKKRRKGEMIDWRRDVVVKTMVNIVITERQ